MGRCFYCRIKITASFNGAVFFVDNVAIILYYVNVVKTEK